MKKISILFSLIIFMQHAHAQSWNLTSNTATCSTTNFIGTKDNQALVFRTNNAEQIRILSDAKIGIGVTSPLQKIHVNGIKQQGHWQNKYFSR
ncbi:MAG: hypothetical protein ABI863_00930 [Ginsengibacter sp.]